MKEIIYSCVPVFFICTMKQRKHLKLAIITVVSFGLMTLLLIPSCKHDLVYNDPVIPIDTSHQPIDTTHLPVDTIHCDTCVAGVISFTEDVLPILQSNCAQTNCHDAASHTEGLNASSYTSLMSGSHKPTSLTGSFWQSITTGADNPMPPNGPLTSAQLLIIQQWIQQGSQNTTCSHICTCDSTNVSFAATIYPVVQTYCLGCHNAGSAQGGVNLTGYANVLAQVNNSKLMKTIKHETGPGIVAMPYNAAKLNDCTIAKFQSWVNAGAPNN